MTEPGYLAREMAAVDAGLLPRGKVTMCDVAHDDWCELYAGTSDVCTCQPDIVCRFEGDDGEIVTVTLP